MVSRLVEERARGVNQLYLADQVDFLVQVVLKLLLLTL